MRADALFTFLDPVGIEVAGKDVPLSVSAKKATTPPRNTRV